MTDIDQIKQKIDIVSLISEYVSLKKSGANFKGLCPFHNEKTPSFMVSPERQIWHCFGGCQDGGDIFKFLMRIENVEFSESLKTLAKKAGVQLSTFQPSKTTEIREKIFEINLLASEFYNYILTSHSLGQTARDYLADRKITDNSIKLFSLGYAPNSWDSLIKFMIKKKYSLIDLEAAGLVSKSSIGHYFDRFRGRVIFTLRDHHGEVVGFAGRQFGEVYPAEGGAKYINTAETPVYIKGNVLYGLDTNKEEIKKEGFAVIVEGEVDAIKSYQAGVRNVVAIKGSALTSGHVALLKRYTENILLSLDSDFAGDAAAHRGIMIADGAGLNIKVVTFSTAKDPDELININPSLWHDAIKKAVPFYDYIITSALSKYDPKSPLEAKKIVTEVAKFLEPIDNLVVKNHYLKKLASLLDLPQDDLETQITREFRKLQLTVSSAVLNKNENIKESPRTRTELSEEYLLSLLLQSPKPSDYLVLILPRLTPEDFTNPTLAKIYNILAEMPDKTEGIKEIAALMPEELLPLVDRLYLQENNIPVDDDSFMLAEIHKIVWSVKELALKNKLKEISLEIKSKPDQEGLDEEFSKVTLQLQKLLDEKKLLEQKP